MRLAFVLLAASGIACFGHGASARRHDVTAAWATGNTPDERLSRVLERVGYARPHVLLESDGLVVLHATGADGGHLFTFQEPSGTRDGDLLDLGPANGEAAGLSVDAHGFLGVDGLLDLEVTRSERDARGGTSSDTMHHVLALGRELAEPCRFRGSRRTTAGDACGSGSSDDVTVTLVSAPGRDGELVFRLETQGAGRYSEMVDGRCVERSPMHEEPIVTTYELAFDDAVPDGLCRSRGEEPGERY